MLLLATLNVVFYVLVLSTSAQDIRYVKSNSSSPLDCPSQPCLTLEKYIEEKNRYFTAGATFLFLDGNHSLHTELALLHVSNLSLMGAENGSSVSILSTVDIIAFNTTNITIERLTFRRYNSALRFFKSKSTYISNSIFMSAASCTLPALLTLQSDITITNCLFEDNVNTQSYGGAFFADSQTNLTLIRTNFTRNRANVGGAIYARNSSIILQETVFENNFCHLHIFDLLRSGGALFCTNCIVKITGNNHFKNNSCSRTSLYCGGAIGIYIGKLTVSGVAHFLNNEAHYGALYLHCLHALIKGKYIEFKENRGGAIRLDYTQFNIETQNYEHCNLRNEKTIISANFTNNVGYGISVEKAKNVTLLNLSITGGIRAINIEGSSVEFEGTNSISDELNLYKSNVTFTGNTSFCNSHTHGVQLSFDSSVSFSGYTLFHNNSADNGGAIESVDSTISFTGTTIFTSNTATGESGGGALYALNTRITMEGNVSFSFNSAKNGGAMRLEGTVLTFAPQTTLVTSYNTAMDYGGAIYHEDTVTPNVCNNNNKREENALHYESKLLRCFMQCVLCTPEELNGTVIYSNDDSAGKDGSFLYGGLLDRCKSNFETEIYPFRKYGFLNKMQINSNSFTKRISSKPYQLCFCDNNSNFECNYSNKEIITHRGKSFNLQIIATGQNGSITPTTVTATTIPNSRLSPNQQPLPQLCSHLTYNIYSKESHINLILYPDGPCRDTGTARMVINVTLLPCPDAFFQDGDQCVCEDRLQSYGANCTLGDEIAIIRKAGSKFWMSVLYSNLSYHGLVLYHTCPIDYCTNETIAITLDNLDIQCDHNRTGVLCGACATNYSFLLGNSQCDVCSHHYLALLIPFAIAGIVLVIFLSCLRLTVATGMINSFILYANFVQANKMIFLPSNTINILTVFIAWLNLDLGFQTCFIPGLNAYTQTWLQFSFPLYVWFLVGVIIFSSRYSITISKFIGSNPIAVLATLILMSYTKILKIIIETFSFVKLDYPNGEKVPVWLKDANVPYLQSEHLALSVVTSLVLILFFIPYTILLFTGPCLFRVSHRKCHFFLRRIKPLLDSYYAPYKRNTRYWTGFLLLVRCVLYIVFSFNSLGSTNNSLLAIIITFTVIGFISWYLKRIYRKLFIEVIEGSIYLNLIVLSASVAIITEDKRTALIYTLIGIVFATMIGTIFYQFHLLYITRTASWLKIKAKVSKCLQKSKTTAESEIPVNVPTNSVQPVTKTFIELREPLLEN